MLSNSTGAKQSAGQQQTMSFSTRKSTENVRPLPGNNRNDYPPGAHNQWQAYWNNGTRSMSKGGNNSKRNARGKQFNENKLKLLQGPPGAKVKNSSDWFEKSFSSGGETFFFLSSSFALCILFQSNTNVVIYFSLLNKQLRATRALRAIEALAGWLALGIATVCLIKQTTSSWIPELSQTRRTQMAKQLD